MLRRKFFLTNRRQEFGENGLPFGQDLPEPLEVRGPDIPPPYSGLPSDDRSEWGAFREEYERTHRPTWEAFDDWVREQGAPGLPYLEFIHTSDVLNLYVYPEVVDYVERRPLNATWQRLDSSVRQTDGEAELPPFITDRPPGSALIYLSLGSLGSADVGLMRRLVELLSRTPHRYIVSKGPEHAEYELAGNMWGGEFLPQTKLIPLVDLVITHGGNNTTTEALHFGKPMIVLPLFWDQYDNAQRVDETGFGVRLRTYAFADDELHGAIELLLASPIRGRLGDVSREIRARDGVAKAADAIAAVGSRAGMASRR